MELFLALGVFAGVYVIFVIGLCAYAHRQRTRELEQLRRRFYDC